eukprot:jgi/Botrbrau1/10865/Bobra.0025s0042.1
MIERRKGCLADVTRAWLYIARTLDELKAKLPSAFMDRCEAAYLKHVTEFDVDMCRLALFLDPRYKNAATTEGRFPKLLQKAVDIMKRRGHGKEECKLLIHQMQDYKAGKPPYDRPSASEPFNVKAWWLSMKFPSTQMLVDVSLLMDEIAPFAAYPSQVLPALGWFSKSPRENLKGSFGTKLAVLKSYYENEGSLSFSETGIVIKPEGGGVAKSGEKAWEFPPAQISADELAVVLQQWEARSGDSRPSGALPSLFTAWEGIDVHSPLLDPTYTPQGNPAPQKIGGLGSFIDNDFDAVELVQQYTMDQATATRMNGEEQCVTPLGDRTRVRLAGNKRNVCYATTGWARGVSCVQPNVHSGLSYLSCKRFCEGILLQRIGTGLIRSIEPTLQFLMWIPHHILAVFKSGCSTLQII